MCAVVSDQLDTGSPHRPKRKFDNYALADDVSSHNIDRLRMRKQALSSDEAVSSSLADYGVGCSSSSKKLQFFIRTFKGTQVFHASPEDTVEVVLDRIEQSTGIPAWEQRLIYSGRQLQCDWSLAKCGVENNACLELTGRLRSMEYPTSWLVANDIVSSTCSLLDGNSTLFTHRGNLRDLETLVKVFLMMTPRDDTRDSAWGHLQVFVLSGAPAALVMLYALKHPDGHDYGYGLHAKRSIQLFLYLNSEYLPRYVQVQCAPILLEFCKLLSIAVGIKDPLYMSCRSCFGSLLDMMGIVNDPKHFGSPKPINVVDELFPFAEQLGYLLSEELLKSLTAKLSLVCSLSDVLSEFSNFMVPLRRAIQVQMGNPNPSSMPNVWFESLHRMFIDLLDKVDQCLRMVEEIMVKETGGLSESQYLSWSVFLLVLAELDSLAKIYEREEEKLHSVLLARRVPLNALIRRAKRNDNIRWFLRYKDVTDYEARTNLVMMMFPEWREDYEEYHEMLIDRSHLMAESFEYITHADRYSLQGGLFMEFKNEEATGPGVLREWFCLLCQAIFDPQNVLFVPCPSDRRRFFPNPKSAVDPLHLDYFGFCGRVIALALMHKVQVGVFFDRILFLQLAGKSISLDDVREADPVLYASCKKILEMDADILDSDALGLTFVREIEELGTHRVMELCQGGEHIAVNSKNRQTYVDLLIQHHFVTSISQQVARFSQGFGDILSNSNSQRLFFDSLELEDFDRMLGGSERVICVKDWKAHTEYNGYKKKDRQIKWFWKVVEDMPMEQRRVLIIFWTSVRYLPWDGFGGLPSKLHIYRSSDSQSHLPTSHTCFYQLCLPTYPSISIMRDRLHMVTQEHMNHSFGMW